MPRIGGGQAATVARDGCVKGCVAAEAQPLRGPGAVGPLEGRRPLHVSVRKFLPSGVVCGLTWAREENPWAT